MLYNSGRVVGFKAGKLLELLCALVSSGFANVIQHRRHHLVLMCRKERGICVAYYTCSYAGDSWFYLLRVRFHMMITVTYRDGLTATI